MGNQSNNKKKWNQSKFNDKCKHIGNTTADIINHSGKNFEHGSFKPFFVGFLVSFYIIKNESLKTVIIDIIVIISGLVELFPIMMMMISLIIMIMIMFSMMKFLVLFLWSKGSLNQFTNTFTGTNSNCWGNKEFPKDIHDIFNPFFQVDFCLFYCVNLMYIINVWILKRDINNKYNWYYSIWFWRDRFIISGTV